jgi:hypothetical protein
MKCSTSRCRVRVETTTEPGVDQCKVRASLPATITAQQINQKVVQLRVCIEIDTTDVISSVYHAQKCAKSEVVIEKRTRRRRGASRKGQTIECLILFVKVREIESEKSNQITSGERREKQ